jgi:serine/threonine protein phosphatase PrpC
MVMASDGIWDFLNNEEVHEIVNDYGMRDIGASCDVIGLKVRDNCLSDSSTLDDMTLIISYFH